jgi:hypothetical protein
MHYEIRDRAFADIGGHANGQEPSDVEAAEPPASGGAPPAPASGCS